METNGLLKRFVAQEPVRGVSPVVHYGFVRTQLLIVIARPDSGQYAGAAAR